MNGKAITFAVAAIIGVLATVAWYELRPASESAQGPASLAEAIATGYEFNDSEPSATLDVVAPGVAGSVAAIEDGDLLYLQIQINSDGNTEFHGQMNNADLIFRGVSNRTQESVEGFLFANGNFSIASSPAKDFTVIFESPEGAKAAVDNDIQFVVTNQREIVFRGTLER